MGKKWHYVPCGIYFKNFINKYLLPNTKHSVYMKAGLQDYIMTVTAIITICFNSPLSTCRAYIKTQVHVGYTYKVIFLFK